MADDPAEPGEAGLPLDELIHRADAAELLTEVERAVARRDWGHLFVIRRRCLDAAERLGKQLWPVAQYAEYRIALEAPGPLAARVVQPGAARFALGPLTEVVAAMHTWGELADHLDVPVIAATVAQERVLRGEDLRGDERGHADEVELPLVLAAWEVDPPLPRYRSDELLEGGPEPVERGWRPVDTSRVAGPAAWAAAERAAEELVGHWATGSTGEVHVAAFTGGPDAALAALVSGDVERVSVTREQAVERLLWSSASGGAHGRRRGLAAARASTWWLLANLAGLAWPVSPDELDDATASIAWYAFRTGEPARWELRLVAEVPDRGVSLAIDATDRRSDGEDRVPG